MHELTQLIFHDMKPALGVTEPGAIALAVSTAKRHAPGAIQKITLRLNSGMYKNAFTCGIPGTDKVGNEYAAALGAIAADPGKGLECLDGITDAQVKEAQKMVDSGVIQVSMSGITSRIFIEASVFTDSGSSSVTIQDSHTNIVKITENGRAVFEAESEEAQEENSEPPIHRYSLEALVQYAKTVPLEEILFIRDAFTMNEALMNEGLNNPRTTFARYLLSENGGQIVSHDEQKTASLFCNAAIEARVIGLARPAMSITGYYAASGCRQSQRLFGRKAAARRRPELSGLYVYQGILRQADRLLRLCHRRRHRNGLRACAAARRICPGDGADH